MKYYRNLYIDYSKNYMMALELDNGTIVECYTEKEMLACCTAGGSATSITVNGITFKKNQVVSVYFGNLWNLDYIPIRFCYYFANLIHLDQLPDMITSIGNNFMQYCTSFNQPLLLPSSLTTIGYDFMSYCSSFIQPLTLPSSLTTIGTTFMYQSYNFTGPLEILFTDPNVFASNNSSLAETYNDRWPMYSIGITITGNMTGAQLKTRLPNSTKSPFRKILG